ncbi:Uncharacterized protein DBV15_12267 [Temnothorax longispinosus]|uniref:Myb/SANT-like DNA-binding domain-containing protein n=1 Tax=Temnothorax longispinosus TaxID=300112 RepID=A0A4S2K9F4_9HYME|nr:Uncharacterized protein DBV15_12267 [Temnothorax longispinosus]
MKTIKLYDPETDNTYILEVNEEEAERANDDGFRWPHEAVLLLLEVFKERETKLTSGKMSVKKFWDMVASVLREKDYNVTGSQCKSKMTGLKNTYKSVKDHNAKSGNNKRTWRYFDVNIMNKLYMKRLFFY